MGICTYRDKQGAVHLAFKHINILDDFSQFSCCAPPAQIYVFGHQCAQLLMFPKYRGNESETLAVAADHQLFVSIASNPYHVLRRLYQEKEACGYNLRTRPHNFALPVKDDTNFVSRSLYAELKS